MNDRNFIRLVREAFDPFLRGLGFVMDTPSISGREYCVSFSSQAHSVQIAFEPGDNALFIFVFRCQKGALSDIDDTTATPRLADLNKRFMSEVTADELAENQKFFALIQTNDEEECLVLKAAKELRLVLPKYLVAEK